MDIIKHTEKESYHQHLEQKSTLQLLQGINQEDLKVAEAVQQAIPQIEPLVNIIANRLQEGGKLFYIGAGTSGRLGILDASECPPTFGVPHNMVIGLIAGGDSAIRKAVENAEDSINQGWKDLKNAGIQPNDIVVGIAASGTTPYVITALEEAQNHNVVTACITCNEHTPLAKVSHYPIEVVVGAEFITGSTRMKSGTAQKMVLNMLSTASMIKIGRVKGNRMVDMQLSNAKLVERGTQMILNEFSNLTTEQAKNALLTYGSVRAALQELGKKT